MFVCLPCPGPAWMPSVAWTHADIGATAHRACSPPGSPCATWLRSSRDCCKAHLRSTTKTQPSSCACGCTRASAPVSGETARAGDQPTPGGGAHLRHLAADADRLVSAADLAQFGKLIVAVAKKYFNQAGEAVDIVAGTKLGCCGRMIPGVVPAHLPASLPPRYRRLLPGQGPQAPRLLQLCGWPRRRCQLQ